MAPSSTPYDACRSSVLAARDARQGALDRHRGAGRTLVAVSLAVPGAEKTPPGAYALFAWALAEVTSALGDASALHSSADVLGPFAVLATRAAALDAKARCVSIETARPAARLLDLDVYSPDGAPLDRARLHLPDRPCLCCDRPARECIRAGRHDLALVARAARALLASAAG
jgi:holo-ACP synthase CitX